MEGGSGPNRHGNRKGHRPAVRPTSEEKRLLDVCITVKFESCEGDIEGAVRVLQGTTIAGLLFKILTKYRDAFTQDWPHVMINKRNERTQRALPIPASEFAQKQCEDGACYEALFFAQGADGPPRIYPKKGVVDFGDDEPPPSRSPQGQDSRTLKHNRYWYPVKSSSVHPGKGRLQYEAHGHRMPQTANHSSILQSQEVKHEEDGARSNVADSRLGAGSNTQSCQEEGSATVSGDWSVDFKQDIDDAANAVPLGVTVSLREAKHEADGEGSNVADSRLGVSINTPTRQDEGSATAPVARNVDFKHESVEADVPRNNTDLLAQAIVREGAKLEDAYSVNEEGLDDTSFVDTASVHSEPVVTDASNTYPVGRQTRVVRLRSGTEVQLVPRRSIGTPPSSTKEPASLFARTRKRREKKKIETRKVRQMKLLKKRTAEAEAEVEAKAEIVSEMDVEAEAEEDAAGGKNFPGTPAIERITNTTMTKRTAASSSHKRTAPVEQQHASRKRNADTGADEGLSELTTKRVQLVRKLRRKEAAIVRLETDLQDESRVPAWRVEQRSVGSWRAKRMASLQKAKQEHDEVLEELKVTEGVLVLYRAARRWYIDHGKSREFFTKLRKDGYDRPEKIIRHFWKSVSHVDRTVLFELCVTESPFVFESDPHKLESWREAFASEEAFNDYFNYVFYEEASGWHRFKFCDPSMD